MALVVTCRRTLRYIAAVPSSPAVLVLIGGKPIRAAAPNGACAVSIKYWKSKPSMHAAAEKDEPTKSYDQARTADRQIVRDNEVD